METQALCFSYLPPTIDMVLPSTMDADGVAVTVRGANFGREQDVYKWSVAEAAVAVSIGEPHLLRCTRRQIPCGTTPAAGLVVVVVVVAVFVEVWLCMAFPPTLSLHLSVTVSFGWTGGVECVNAQRVTRANRPALECTMGKQTVGYKNVSIVVAAQNGSLGADGMLLIALCARNNYGQMGELVRVWGDPHVAGVHVCMGPRVCRSA